MTSYGIWKISSMVRGDLRVASHHFVWLFSTHLMIVVCNPMCMYLYLHIDLAYNKEKEEHYAGKV